VGDQLGTMETNEFLNLGQTLIHYASADNLNFIGEIFGVYRLGQQIASVSQGDTNFRFYVAGGGRFGDINSGSDINLPAGTLILSPASNSPIFITDTAVVAAAHHPVIVAAGNGAASAAGAGRNRDRHRGRTGAGAGALEPVLPG
jgi:hypothetical protein